MGKCICASLRSHNHSLFIRIRSAIITRTYIWNSYFELVMGTWHRHMNGDMTFEAIEQHLNKCQQIANGENSIKRIIIYSVILSTSGTSHRAWIERLLYRQWYNAPHAVSSVSFDRCSNDAISLEKKNYNRFMSFWASIRRSWVFIFGSMVHFSRQLGIE